MKSDIEYPASREDRNPLISGGRVNLQMTGLKPHPLSDLYHFLITADWSKFIALAVLAYLALNVGFAGLYVATGAEIRNAEPGSFRDAFFFSVQTMSTIGFGYMSPGDVIADTLVAFQSVIGLLGIGIVGGLIFAKFARPASRLVFSKRAAIAVRDNVPALVFRVANERGNNIYDGRLFATLTRLEHTAEGELVRRFYPLELERPTTPLFSLVWQGTHVIDVESPLHPASRASLREGDQIVVSASGIDQDLGYSVQTASSYLPEDVAFGCRLADMLRIEEDGTRTIDFSQLHEVIGEH